ncbi:MAG: phytanoyl-CoA dioxygenase, partial [Pseudomonadota bacterium]|nr:phytanoyl-CoA dioxygenase [Pseudomonadota bacterium]
MPKVLSEEQVEQFHREGFLSPVPVLSPEEVERYRSHLEAFEAKYPNDRRKLKSKSHLLCPWVDEIARKSHLLDVYEDLIGPNILCYSMAFRIKEADGKTFAGWHQDGAYNPIKPIL